jgi:hypothetical protein
MDPRKLPKLSRVIALGFPLGSRTQADTVNASVVRGSVRRVFENMFQIDASLHGGHSGGPVIDARGKVIGIVAAVAMDFSQGLVPIVTPVWDIGLILPITDVQLLRPSRRRSGPALISRRRIPPYPETRFSGRWAEAMTADAGGNPAGHGGRFRLLHFCNGDYPGARQRFTQSLSMDPEDDQARLMLVLIDWLTGSQDSRAQHQELAAADWRSPAEFQGYLLQVLERQVGIDAALKAWTSSSEKGWVHYIGGLLRLRQGRPEEAEKLIGQALLSADPEGWEFLLARAKLEEIRKQRRTALKAQDKWAAYSAHMEHSTKK